MSETYGNYTATVVDTGDPISHEIDVRPPFAPGEEFLDDCGAECCTILKHFVTTPNTTRLSVTLDEQMAVKNWTDEMRDEAFRTTAAFIVKALQLVDEGRSSLKVEAWELET